ncbi:hypothetical protein PV08_02756 [Exophiala spinifera]|uniref:UBC core domain-containing protein n=1 Tax=Exophiala spinifera TaxID=91928 RepID=A0A0D2BHR2_9EURO|nr:uncharacterized protein PV08_02756 [Exophiala spinifera]KIW18468.1 hypothetical protein PV08_02756 [Exophiala spinifera]
MGRRQFLQHLAAASVPTIKNIEGVHTPDEGVVSFIYCCPGGCPISRVNIQACATNLDDYPHDNVFMLFTEDDRTDPVIPQTLQSVGAETHGKSLSQVLAEVSQRLTVALEDGRPADNLEAASEGPYDDDFEFDYGSDDDTFGLADLQPSKCAASNHGVSASRKLSRTARVYIGKIHSDLKALKDSGFRVGIFGNPAGSGILCASVRVSKLGLSDEAMQAWSLRRKQYFVLLIRYVSGYYEARDITDLDDLVGRVDMQVGLCWKYKPTLEDAHAVFSGSSPSQKDRAETSCKSLEPLFIGTPLNQFLKERFFNIVKARHLYSLSWLGAEKMVEARAICTDDTSIESLKDYQCDDNASEYVQLPKIVMADHMAEVSLENASLPLIAIQFALRHLVRCTEFCLVCHSRVDNSFEALKPYVCSRPLCLYQYMNLGFGPSLEWEIRSQPYVVDLLVSFCFIAASAGRIKELPVGLNLMVPLLPSGHADVLLPATAKPQAALPPSNTTRSGSPAASEKAFSCTWHVTKQRLDLVDQEIGLPLELKPGDWIVTIPKERHLIAHHRVTGVLPDSVDLDQTVFVDAGETDNEALVGSGGESEKSMRVDCYVYNKNFDDLTKAQQQSAIVALLSALPSVSEMCTRLKSFHDASLESWHRISKSSLTLLRWIVASNRSCILPVGESQIGDDLVGGMDGYMQFRFAQGAPDKEKRFNDAVQSQSRLSGTQYPTLFAWHGSRLANWHSIVRQGLRFDEIAHGRSFGHGVYLSPQADTSLGYSQNASRSMGTYFHEWKPSMLKISNALSLNEVVNHPRMFVSCTPHYVISKLDWIQTRYLFVQASGTAGGAAAAAAKSAASQCREVYQQDPSYKAVGVNGRQLTIPLTAISKSRRRYDTVQAAKRESGKRSKQVVTIDQETAERHEDDAKSVVSDASDLAFFAQDHDDDQEVDEPNPDGSALGPSIDPTQDVNQNVDKLAGTDFVPGTLDVSDIRFLKPPQDATRTSTQALMRCFRETLSVQDKTPLATLGWYIDGDKMSNMYQWIVEMHSFPPTLPLAKDMQAHSITSIVLEMRFSNQFPFSPPFIRVVKPRFLPFAQGGGGNVTDGGAMCMEVLTNNGWTAAQNIESLLLQVRMSICDEERPARLAPVYKGKHNTYAIGEAIQAYVRACRNHGWRVPAGFDKIQKE